MDCREKSANQQDQEVDLHFCTFEAALLQPLRLLQCKVRSSFSLRHSTKNPRIGIKRIQSDI
jgi:hypothetical protein